jgi:AGZA family xanthine/uracil permease-like MFS transporter
MSSSSGSSTTTRYEWARGGDVNAFFGLMIDNVAVMVLLFAILTNGVPYKFDPVFVIAHLIPGTAIGVLIGDLIYTWMAFRLAWRLGRPDVTAMPLGLDTPSTIGFAFLILLPALAEARDRLAMDQAAAMLFSWRVGVLTLIACGVFKICCSFLGNVVRRLVPSAGLLGSLAAIALTLIAFLPLLMDGIAAVPLVGMLALVVILATLVAHRRLPGRFPGALAAVLLGVLAYLLFDSLGDWLQVPLVPPRDQPISMGSWQPPQLFLALFGSDARWDEVIAVTLSRLPVAIPFALATVVAGIDCTESAAAVGDEFDARAILLTEGVSSLIAAVLGGVVQTTPYIGQPAYKKMGGRAAYTVATALFIGIAGYFGLFVYLFEWLPKAAMFPILVFVGLEITAQSFKSTPQRHHAALALAMLPALAALVVIPLRAVLGPREPADQVLVVTLNCLANGFIVTSLLWAAALAALIDGKLRQSAGWLAIAGVAALFGIIHSPSADSPIALPGTIYQEMMNTYHSDPRMLAQSPFHWAAAYGLSAITLLALSLFRNSEFEPEESARDRNTA